MRHLWVLPLELLRRGWVWLRVLGLHGKGAHGPAWQNEELALTIQRNVGGHVNAFGHEAVTMLIAKMLYGDGRENDCRCGHCDGSWFDRGWVCPHRWFLVAATPRGVLGR